MSFSVQEVAQLLKQAKENEKPYVFFTGAGCSISAGVPSATGLIEEIRKQFPIQVKNIDHEKDQFNYGKYMSVLDKDERRRLLKPHIIDNKNINWAHIALACLMESGYVQRVLTFNFDSILSRACNLLGLHPSIYDFATANPHLYHLINDPSIVHLHGQGTGFIQLNTKEETQDHTEKLGDFIAATLNSNPSLFIGYSGNADEFFPLLEKKYSEQHRLIWTGRKEKIEDIEAESVKEFLKQNNNLTHYIGNVDADHFLVQLAKELDCFPPELFSNPYKFLNQQLENVQEYPLGDGLDILANLTDYLKEQSTKPLNKSLYTAIIHKYPNKTSTKGLSDKSLNEIMWAYNQQAKYLANQKKFEDSLKIYAQALSINENHYGCLHNYGISLYESGLCSKDVEKFKLAESIFIKSIKLQPLNFNSVFGYANTLLQHAYITQDEQLYQQAIINYKAAIAIEPQNYKAIANYATALKDLADLNQNTDLYIQSIFEFEKAIGIESNDKELINLYAWAVITYTKLKPNYPSAIKITELLENSLTNVSKNINLLETLTSALLIFYKVFNDNEFLVKVSKHLETLHNLSPKKTYNYACYYSLTNQSEQCKEMLLNAEINDSLPKQPYTYINQDKDLDNVRNEPWFTELLNRLKEKEVTEKAS